MGVVLSRVLLRRVVEGSEALISVVICLGSEGVLHSSGVTVSFELRLTGGLDGAKSGVVTTSGQSWAGYVTAGCWGWLFLRRM